MTTLAPSFLIGSSSFTVILFCLFYSRIKAASQSKKGLYFPIFGDSFPNLRILLRFISKFKRHRLCPKEGNKITDLVGNKVNYKT